MYIVYSKSEFWFNALHHLENTNWQDIYEWMYNIRLKFKNLVHNYAFCCIWTQHRVKIIYSIENTNSCLDYNFSCSGSDGREYLGTGLESNGNYRNIVYS